MGAAILNDSIFGKSRVFILAVSLSIFAVLLVGVSSCQDNSVGLRSGPSLNRTFEIVSVLQFDKFRFSVEYDSKNSREYNVIRHSEVVQ